MRLKKVVLPAPLGPMMACSSPAFSSNETSRVATKPANDFHRPSMCEHGAHALLPRAAFTRATRPISPSGSTSTITSRMSPSTVGQ